MAKTNMSVKFSKVYIDEDDLLNLCDDADDDMTDGEVDES